MKLNLTYINRTERASAKTGKPFTSISIKAKEYGEKYLSGFGNKTNSTWKEGDEVEVAEVKEVVKDGKTYLNFEMPKAFNGSPEIQKALEEINNRTLKTHLLVEAIAKHILPPQKDKVPGTDIPYPDYTGEPNFDPKEDDGLDQIDPNSI